MRHHYFYSECEGVGNIKSLTSSHSFCFIPIRFQRMCGEIIYVVFWTRWSHDIWSRTSRRCANRNRHDFGQNRWSKRSHLTQVRESKSQETHSNPPDVVSHLTQVRESKFGLSGFLLGIRRSHLTQVRESKYRSLSQ